MSSLDKQVEENHVFERCQPFAGRAPQEESTVMVAFSRSKEGLSKRCQIEWARRSVEVSSRSRHGNRGGSFETNFQHCRASASAAGPAACQGGPGQVEGDAGKVSREGARELEQGICELKSVVSDFAILHMGLGQLCAHQGEHWC